MQTVEEYLKHVTPTQRAEYERIRKIVKKQVPDADEVISYGIPTFKHNGKYVIYFAAFKDHMSIYPVFKGLLEEMKDGLGDFKITKETLKSKGTVQYTEDNLVPEVLVKELIKINLQRHST
jgi:uncharacterized protein YdhG (YjbR/CyaY superfamily)